MASSIAALAIWALALIGIAAGFFPRQRPGSPALAAGACLGLLATLTGLSALWSSDPGASFDESIIALAYAGLFVLVILASRRGDARAWLAGLAIGLGAVAVFALGARLEPSLFGEGEAEAIARLPASIGRLGEPFTYWNALAAAMASAVILLGWLGGGAHDRLSRTLALAALPTVLLVLYMTTSRGGAGAAVLGLIVLVALTRERIRLVAALLIGGLGGGLLIAFTSSRSELLDQPLGEVAKGQAGGVELAVLAVTAFVLAVAWFADPALERRRAVRVRIGSRGRALAIAAAAVALIVAIVVADPASRWEEFKEPPQGPVAGDARDLLGRGGSSGRYQFWEAALDAFEGKPVAGIGAAGYEYYWNRNGSLPEPAPNGHSLLFDTAAELGLLGVLLVLGFGAIVVVAAARRIWPRADRGEAGAGADPDRSATAAAAALLVAGAAGAAIDWIWESPAALAATIVAAALLVGPACAANSGAPADAGERRTRRRFAAGVFVIAFSWVAICASALVLLTDLSLSASREAFARGDLDAAADAANDAVDLEPWAAQPRQQLGLVLEATQDVPAAQAEIEAAIERSPEDWRLRLLAARLELEAGDLAGARAAVIAGRELAPRLSVFAQPVGEVLDGLR